MTARRIIVAEDNRILQDVIRFNLARAGFQVLTADDGRQVLEILRTHEVDLLVTDCQMPGLSGLELVRALRRDPQWCDLPVLFCTAKGFEIESSVLEELKLPDLVCKPFSPAELIGRISVMLGPPGDDDHSAVAGDSTAAPSAAAESTTAATSRE